MQGFLPKQEETYLSLLNNITIKNYYNNVESGMQTHACTRDIT